MSVGSVTCPDDEQRITNETITGIPSLSSAGPDFRGHHRIGETDAFAGEDADGFA